MGPEHESAPVGIDERMTLATLDLLARIIASGAAAFRGFDALAVDDRRRRRGFPANPFAVGHHQRMIDPLKQAAVAKDREPTVDRLPRREPVRQQPPRTTGAHNVEDRIHDLAPAPRQRPAITAVPGHPCRDQPPFDIRQITLVTQLTTAILPPGGWGPHGSVQEGFR